MNQGLDYILLQYYVQTKRYLGNGYILPLFVVCFAYLMIANKSFRQRFGYGMLILFIAIACPPLYFTFWHKLFGGITWRIFWILCETFICSYALIEVTYKIHHKSIRIICLCCLLAITMLCGTFVYAEEGFRKADNAYKLTDTAVAIAEYLLSIDEAPRAIVHGRINTQIRQYSDKITMLYGRDIYGYGIAVTDEDVLGVYDMLKQSKLDAELVTKVAKENGIKYLIVRKRKGMKQLPEYGWRLIEKIDGYYIYLRS